ncbi:Serine/threonine-protein kinase PK-1 [Streptomyces sp. RB5]|uniref:non-specific serine/threonine protein kinase n=1 Tax=Streptomyces smaragdinus TaxID=2585196 RepID=A0A7K0CP70_9ACTN|nr:Stk1 family PASTA domain-containing Ser/Thr kinase [Streptomyces smaragdinus]MQY15278.1 Serine/threonine-protein kinase PK-1 [Streptomyces smaragdinus]
MDTTLHDPLVGRTLDGRYRVDARIAAGGMATVYRALDLRLDRVVAVKVMLPALAAEQDSVERFIREAKAAAALAHANVVGVYDQGIDGPYVFLAMEYIAGCTLRDVLRERGALQPRAALDILEPILAALGAAHRAGLIHRDMKPENVLIGDDGRVKVADFGLVRAVNTHSTNATGRVMGTVSYLAPEQIQGGTTTPRVDVYACGVLLYEMLTGHKPHRGDGPAQVLYQALHEDVGLPSELAPGVAPELDGLVLAATARDPQRRPADAVELFSKTRAARAALTEAQLDALPPTALREDSSGSENLTSVLPQQAALLNRTSVLPVPPPQPPQPPPGPRPGARPRRGGPRGGLIALLAALLVLGVGAGVWYINSGQFTKVPLVIDKTEAQAGKALEQAGLRYRTTERFDATVARGHVISSDPGQGERIRDHGTVRLVISRGPEVVPVPQLEGMTLGQARKTLERVGLVAGKVTEEFHDSYRRGSVISSGIAAGEDVKGGTAVPLVVSKGRPVEVPDVVGEDEGDAVEELEDAGFTVDVSPQREFSAEDEGKVAATDPTPGSEAAEGERITLTISKGQDLVEVPDVEGLSADEAEEQLVAAGFTVNRNSVFFGDKVFNQSPDGGDEAPRGSEITIWIK